MSIINDDHLNIYKSKISGFFPSIYSNDVNIVLKIIPMNSNDIYTNDGLTIKMNNLISDDYQCFNINSEILKIYSRIYFNEPNIEYELELNELQKSILNCIYLKHCDGYIRHRRLTQLANTNNYFQIPFIFQLLGEYVIELLEEVDKHIIEKNKNEYCHFILENKKYWEKTKSRVISYWNAYYRNNQLKEYIGMQIVKRLETYMREKI